MFQVSWRYVGRYMGRGELQATQCSLEQEQAHLTSTCLVLFSLLLSGDEERIRPTSMLPWTRKGTQW